MVSIDRIKTLRIKKGITITQLAAKLGMEHSAIYNLEAGRIINPTINTIVKYCEFYNIMPYDLLPKERSEELLKKYLAKIIREGIIDERTANAILVYHGCSAF